MKMKLSDRLILQIGGIATLLTGVFSLIGGVVLLKYCTYEHILLEILPYLLFAFGIFGCLDGVFDILLPRRYHPGRRAFISQHTEHGEMRIAVSAVENLILRCVETHKEVKVIAMQISNRRGAVSVDLCVAVNGNISIPHAVEQIQMQIKRYLAASSGIELREVGVSVERTEGDEFELPVEPLAQAAEMMAAVHGQEEEIAMHQRVFGRDTSKSVAEQVTEAEVIDLPAEDDAEPETAVEEDAEEAEQIAQAEECEADTLSADEELSAGEQGEWPAEEASEEENEEPDEWVYEDAQELPELPGTVSEDASAAVAAEDKDTAEDDEPADEEPAEDGESSDAEAQE